MIRTQFKAILTRRTFHRDDDVGSFEPRLFQIVRPFSAYFQIAEKMEQILDGCVASPIHHRCRDVPPHCRLLDTDPLLSSSDLERDHRRNGKGEGASIPDHVTGAGIAHRLIRQRSDHQGDQCQ